MADPIQGTEMYTIREKVGYVSDQVLCGCVLCKSSSLWPGIVTDSFKGSGNWLRVCKEASRIGGVGGQ